jgi:hypothetical protein
MSTEGLPPQRRQGGTRSGPPSARRGGGRNLSPKEGAEEAERRIGKPCFHAGQRVQGIFGCVACQFQIRNRGVLPACPDCGEIIWAYLEEGPRPVPEGEEGQPTATPAAAEKPAATVEEGVKLPGPVSVQENVKLEP